MGTLGPAILSIPLMLEIICLLILELTVPHWSDRN